jgi:hypothetical protein
MHGKLTQKFGSFRRQKNIRTAAIRRRPRPSDHSAKLQPVYQPNSAVMPEQKPFRQITNTGGFRLARLDREHQLVLLRFNSRATGRFFAEMEELADLMAKLGQGPDLLL